MFTFFRKVKRVVAWLEDSDGLDHAFLAELERDPPVKDLKDFLDRMTLLVHDICRRPWFHRTWVRQEVFAARDLSLHLWAKNDFLGFSLG